MSFENRKWVIINVASVTNEMLAASLEGRIIRKTLDGSKAILKWDGDTPAVFDGMTTYTHSEIKIELAKSEWDNNA